MTAELHAPATAPAPTSLRQAWIALAGLSAVFLFEMLDNSVLTVALPTIGRELAATTTELQWVTAAYAVVFGGLMLAFGALADRFGRRRLMLTGLTLLATASLATALVTSAWQLIAVRAVLGVAAAMTTPGSMALAFRLFRDDALRVRATTLISTVGLVGLAIGPTLGGLAIAVAPWQALLLVNAPIALLALLGVRVGIAPDDPAELHRAPVDVLGALLGTATVVLALVTPTLAVDAGGWTPWATGLAAVAAALGFAHRQRTAAHPLLDPALLARPLVASGLAYKAAAGMATAGLGYLVALQLQLDWGWSPAQAALGTLPQVVVLLAGGAFVQPLLSRLGFDRAAWLGAAAVVAGLAEYALLGRLGYPWVALALVLVALGLRVVGVVAAMNVLRGLPENRTTIGAALTDTASEVTSAVGLAVVGTSLALLFGADLTAPGWTPAQTAHFHLAVTTAALVLTALAAALVGWGLRRSRAARA
ncbi:MFS transporter [Actinosynnema pretiosum]|uniref:MFS transporter n=1 Tax=Actinosynnema pretiosum TaxID=42197 RepID=UPI0027E2DDF1|nr:MFS transporter [Actinosynnema pretiosum]